MWTKIKVSEFCTPNCHIRMRSHGLRQFVDGKSVASCQQTCCKLIANYNVIVCLTPIPTMGTLVRDTEFLFKYFDFRQSIAGDINQDVYRCCTWSEIFG